MRTKHSLSVLKGLSVNLLDSSYVSVDHQTEINVSYKHVMSVLVCVCVFTMDKGKREWKKTSYISSSADNSFDHMQ